MVGLADAGHPAEVVNAAGASPFVLVCEHASPHIPNSLNGLGLSEPDLSAHIAWDPGAADVARRMAEQLDASLVLQRYSRLVYDCNRPPDSDDAMPVKSENTVIPGNAALSDEDREIRIEEIYRPFHAAVSDVLRGRQAVLVTVHSFTPVYKGVERHFELGVLHDKDSRLADAILALPEAGGARRNEPYGPQDGVTHTLNLHAAGGLLNVMLEIRNDLISDAETQAEWAERLSRMLTQAIAGVAASGEHGFAIMAG